MSEVPKLSFKNTSWKAGTRSNTLQPNSILAKIISTAIFRSASDVYFFDSSDEPEFKQQATIVDIETGIKDRDLFNKIFNEIFPNQNDKDRANAGIEVNLKWFDYGISCPILDPKTFEPLGENQISRLRINISSCIDGRVIAIRPGMTSVPDNVDMLTTNLWLVELALNIAGISKKYSDEFKTQTVNKRYDLDTLMNIFEEIKNDGTRKGDFYDDNLCTYTNEKFWREARVRRDFIESSIPKLMTFDCVSSNIKIDFQATKWLLLITGDTGDGKSTLCTTSLYHRLKTSKELMVTIEDPVEYIFPPRSKDFSSRCIQCEVWTHIAEFTDGMRIALRQNPNIIYMQEVRDRASAESLMTMLWCGKPVITTLHTNGVSSTIKRFIWLLEVMWEKEKTVLQQVAQQIVCIINQKIVRIKNPFTNKVETHGIQEYFRPQWQERVMIEKGDWDSIEWRLSNSPPNTSLTMIAFYLYAMGVIDMNTSQKISTNERKFNDFFADSLSPDSKPITGVTGSITWTDIERSEINSKIWEFDSLVEEI